MAKIKKRYILSSAQANARPHKNFKAGLENFAQETSREIIYLPTFGMNASEQDMHPFFADADMAHSDRHFNESIKFEPRFVRPQAIDPSAGLNHIVGQGKSVVFAHPQIRVRYIPDGDLSKHPKALLTTGAVTLPNYSDKDERHAERRRLGRIARDHHQFGAMLLDVVGPKKYHFRHVEADSAGRFVDLGQKWDGLEEPTDSVLEAMVLGDIHNGRQDPVVQEATDRMILEYEPKRIILHDFVDMLSINPHDSKELIYSQIREKVDKGNTSLERELKEAHTELMRLSELSEGADIYLVPCNHHEFLNRWLDEGKFVTDASNAKLGFKLAEAYARGKDPTETGIKLVGGKLPRNIKFLNYDQTLKVRGWELSNHGHKGPSGGYGSMRSKEYMYGKSVTGHCHCFSDDTEVLTKEGWKLYGDLKTSDLIATMNRKTYVLEWSPIHTFFKYEGIQKIMKGKNRNLDFQVTDNHKMVFRNKKHSGVLQECDADQLLTTGEKNIPVAVDSDRKQTYDLDELRLLVWILADGSVEDNAIRWHFKKQRKIEILSALLDKLNLDYTVNVQKAGTTKLRLKTVDSAKYVDLLSTDKRMPESFRHLNLTEAKTLLKEYSVTDGCRYQNAVQISTSKKRESDILQQCFITNGMRTSISVRDNDRINPSYILTVNDSLNSKWVRLTKTLSSLKEKRYSGDFVWCLEVNNNTLVTRRNGKPCVTGNSYERYHCTNTVGVQQPRNVHYMKGSPSKWTNTNCLLWDNGKPQFLNIIEGQYRARG